MDIELIFKIAAVGVIVAVINILLAKSGRDEQALMVTIAGLVIVLVVVVQEIGTLMESLRTIFGF